MLEMKWSQMSPEDAWAEYLPTTDDPWDERKARHLLQRTNYAARAEELERALQQTPARVADALVDQATEDATQDGTFEFLRNQLVTSNNTEALGSWWVYRFFFTESPLRERMTLNWHSHFATSADKVPSTKLMLNQNRLLRRNALGSFRDLTHGISQDPAMLIYLDSATNRKAHPNENYARELMELFCLGEGHYSETDVVELARCFTGWEIRRDKYRFNAYQHDDEPKKILGKKDSFPESTAIDWVLDQPRCSQYLADRIYRWLIADEPIPSTPFLQPIADELQQNDLRVEPAIRLILKSRWFYSTAALARRIKSPVEYLLSITRPLHITSNMSELANDLRRMGQSLFFPPNVKGWEGGRTWINASTLLSRANSVTRLLHDPKTRYDGQSLEDYLAERSLKSVEDQLTYLTHLLLNFDPQPSTLDAIVQAAGSYEAPEERFKELLRTLVLLPQFQLT
jgi:uncharacterized protein (DUF1800 family)